MGEKDVNSKERGELRGAWRWLAGTMAVLITLGILGGLVYHRLSVRSVNN